MNKVKVNSHLLTVLYITGFIISGSISALCLTTMGQSTTAKGLMVGIVIIFEFGKGISYFEYVSQKHQRKITRMWLLTWITLTAFSLFASMAFTVNESSKSKNTSFTSNTEYESKIDKEKRIEYMISAKEKQIDKISKEKEVTVKTMEKEREKLPEYYTTKRQEALDNITSYSDKQQKKIDEYTKELEELNSKLNLATDKRLDTDYEKNDTVGYVSILTAIANFINNCGFYFSTKWSYEDLELVFYFLLSLILEILICLLYYLKKYYELNAITEEVVSNENKTQIKNENKKLKLKQRNENAKVYKLPNRKYRLSSYPKEIKTEQRNDNTENKNSIGFKMEKNKPRLFERLSVSNGSENEFNNDELKQYLNFVYENKNGTISPGERKISENTNLSYKQIKSIRYFLEDQDILKIVSKTPYLKIEDLNEVYKIVGLENKSF